MAKYLISFPAPAMKVPADELPAVGEAAREVIRAAKQAGVYVFGGGLNGAVPPQLVAADGTATNETYPQTKDLSGGFCVLAIWLARTAHWAMPLPSAPPGFARSFW